MGVIFGYISLTDKPIDSSIAEAMRKANSFWGPDGDGLFTCEHAAIGSLIMFNTPEAIFEKQPIHFEDNRKVLVATARIDNRDDLCRIFNIPLSARDIYPDSFYIQLAYEKWGEACPDHLIGDWSFAVYDKTTRKLFIARDQHGIMACYYYQGPDFFVFSSSLKGILCLPQVEKKVNEYKIAQLLVNWNEGGPQTCYQNIFRLPPAHTLTLENTKVITNRYWYLEHTPEIHLKNDQEYIEMFRDLYTEAVRCRLRSYRPIGATLSGGLDSGSVCILAAQELAKYGKRLPAFTAVPMYDVPWPKNRVGDEGPLALALTKKLGNVDVTLCKAENISPIEGVEIMMDVHDQPGFAANNAFWLSNIFVKCRDLNLGTILTGQSGNGSVSWPTGSLLNQNDHVLFSILHYIYTYLNYNIGNWKHKFDVSEEILNNKVIINGIKKSRIKKPFITKKMRIEVIRPGKNLSGDRWFEIGIFFKTEVRDPTKDIRLINYLVGLPLEKQRTRFIFNSCFSEYFPEDITNAELRGIQSVDLIKRLENVTKEDFNIEISDKLCSFLNQTKLKSISRFSNKYIKLYMIDSFLKEVNDFKNNR